MDTISIRGERHLVSNGLRIAAGVMAMGLLAGMAPHVQTFAHAVLYVATWVTLLHIILGVYVLTRCLHAYGRIQQGLDVVAGLLLMGTVMSFNHPVFWCSFLAGVVGIAVLKYAWLLPVLQDRTYKRYVREKILLEGPAAGMLGLAAAILTWGDVPSWISLGIQLFLLAGTTAFAVWMVGVRKRYRALRRYARSKSRFLVG